MCVCRVYKNKVFFYSFSQRESSKLHKRQADGSHHWVIPFTEGQNEAQRSPAAPTLPHGKSRWSWGVGLDVSDCNPSLRSGLPRAPGRLHAHGGVECGLSPQAVSPEERFWGASGAASVTYRSRSGARGSGGRDHPDHSACTAVCTGTASQRTQGPPAPFSIGFCHRGIPAG